MRALERLASGHGPSHLALVEHAVRAPRLGEVRVRMRRAPIHPSDFNWMNDVYHGAMATMPWNEGESELSFDAARTELLPKAPFVLGGEGMGIVEATGRGLERCLLGRRVAVRAFGVGAYCDALVLDASAVRPLPDDVDDDQGAMLFTNPLSAYLLVHEVLRIERGARVLVSAASSALGRMILRLGVRFGFETYALVRRAELGPELRGLGARAVFTEADEPEARVRALTCGRGVDYVIDCVGGALSGTLVRCLTERGTFVLYGSLAKSALALSPRDVMMRNATLRGFFMPSVWSRTPWIAKARIELAVLELVRSRVLVSEVRAHFPLERYVEAFEEASAQGRSGKTLFAWE